MNKLIVALHGAGVLNDRQMVALRRVHREWSVAGAAPGSRPEDEQAAAAERFAAAMRAIGRNGAAVVLAVVCQEKPLSVIPKLVGCQKGESVPVLVACGEKLAEHYSTLRE